MPYDALTSLAAIKAWVPITSTADDNLVNTLIPIASEMIGRFCGRPNLGKVYTYVENYRPGQRGRSWTAPTWTIVLRHYPIVSLTSVLINNSSVPILANTDVQVGTSGVFLEEEDEPRTLEFRGIVAYSQSPALVTYTAGYSSVPAPLQQACNQLVMEIKRKSGHINQKSIAAAGETTTYDMGGTWGMSNHVQQMLQPFKNVVPFR